MVGGGVRGMSNGEINKVMMVVMNLINLLKFRIDLWCMNNGVIRVLFFILGIV